MRTRVVSFRSLDTKHQELCSIEGENRGTEHQIGIVFDRRENRNMELKMGYIEKENMDIGHRTYGV